MGQSGGGLRKTTEDDGNDDVKRQVDSDDNYQKPIYQLVNVKNGGGQLVEILKSRSKMTSGSFAINKSSLELPGQLSNGSSSLTRFDCEIDQQIHDLVEPLLYNKGEGKLVHLEEIWRARFGKTNTRNEEELARSNGAEARGEDENHRWVCWRLDERGFVGETALHICFLLSTPVHMILARKLLGLFPKLINDIYTCDNYFGESSLHMAIVNENVRIVKLLLDYGANVHERCLGSFFLPNDQKDRANQAIKRSLSSASGPNNLRPNPFKLNENFLDHVIETNYDGYVYWGEYPLSFAICLGLADCFKLLLAKGANPNRQDSNGNSSLHMAVIANRIDMFDLCYVNGANLSVLNRQNLSPLTLAAKLNKVEMFAHILTIQRQVDWIFCNVSFVRTPLVGVDSVDTLDGSSNDDSVLAIVVSGDSNEHLLMLNGLLNRLLEVKWKTSIREKFLWWLFKFLTFLFLTSIAYITRFDDGQENLNNRNNFKYYKRLINTLSEYFCIAFVLYYLLIVKRRIFANNFNWRQIFKSLSQAPEMFVFICTCFMILACIPMRLFQIKEGEEFLVALIMFTLPLKLLFFCRASKSFGSFVVMIYKIVVNDVLCFVVFLIIFVAGFSQSFQIIFKSHSRFGNKEFSLIRENKNEKNFIEDEEKNYFLNFFDGIISMHMMAYNEFGIVLDEFNSTDYAQLAKVLFCIYMVLVSILLINMLIAMLGKTYQDIASQPNENLRQWARALLFVERLWSNEEKLQMLNKYSHEDETNRQNRFYYSTCLLERKDQDEINSMQMLNDENKRNAARLAKQQI